MPSFVDAQIIGRTHLSSLKRVSRGRKAWVFASASCSHILKHILFYFFVHGFSFKSHCVNGPWPHSPSTSVFIVAGVSSIQHTWLLNTLIRYEFIVCMCYFKNARCEDFVCTCLPWLLWDLANMMWPVLPQPSLAAFLPQRCFSSCLHFPQLPVKRLHYVFPGRREQMSAHPR